MRFSVQLLVVDSVLIINIMKSFKSFGLLY